MEKYVPDIYQKSIYTLDYSKLLSRGIKCILFDIDNTLAPMHYTKVSDKAKELIISLKQKGFKVYLFSNGPKKRVEFFEKALGVEGVHFACKPFQKKLKKIIQKTGFELKEIALVGDQILTDVLAGNKVGITTILVTPLSDKDHLPTKIIRYFENRKMKKLHIQNLFTKGEYYD